MHQPKDKAKHNDTKLNIPIKYNDLKKQASIKQYKNYNTIQFKILLPKFGNYSKKTPSLILNYNKLNIFL